MSEHFHLVLQTLFSIEFAFQQTVKDMFTLRQHFFFVAHLFLRFLFVPGFIPTNEQENITCNIYEFEWHAY